MNIEPAVNLAGYFRGDVDDKGRLAMKRDAGIGHGVTNSRQVRFPLRSPISAMRVDDSATPAAATSQRRSTTRSVRALQRRTPSRKSGEAHPLGRAESPMD